MANFAKTLTCPTSYDLAEFASGELDGFWRSLIKRHLVTCDFCNVETELYRRFPLTKYQPVPAPPIPAPLHELAEAILSNG